MFAVIFEVTPLNEGRDGYLALAARLKSLLDNQPGLVSIERFQSLVQEDKLLSLSFWEDDASIGEWRNIMDHRSAQKKGKTALFKSYRIRVARIVRDYSDNDRDHAPGDSNQALL